MSMPISPTSGQLAAHPESGPLDALLADILARNVRERERLIARAADPDALGDRYVDRLHAAESRIVAAATAVAAAQFVAALDGLANAVTLTHPGRPAE